MGLLQYLEQDLIAVNGNVLCWAGLVMTKILEALPSRRSFSTQNFNTAWNNEGRHPQLQEWDDISVFGDMVTQLPFRGRDNVPVFTRYFLSYHCLQCGKQEHNLEHWNDRIFQTVPTLPLVPGSFPITAEHLLRQFLQHVDTACSQCTRPVRGSLATLPGKFTLLHISRSHQPPAIVRTKLIPRAAGEPAPLFMGELVSVVSRSDFVRDGDTLSHYFSYHQVGGQWFKNDDDHPIVGVLYHPFNARAATETVDYLCYKNNV